MFDDDEDEYEDGYTALDLEATMPDLGPCCRCGHEAGHEANPVRNIWMLPAQLPDDVPHGWGCFGCDLPTRGANAVICDECAEVFSTSGGATWKSLTHYMAGDDSKSRRPISELFDRPEWKHDMSKHQFDE